MNYEKYQEGIRIIEQMPFQTEPERKARVASRIILEMQYFQSLAQSGLDCLNGSVNPILLQASKRALADLYGVLEQMTPLKPAQLNKPST
jgi:hypothetical protein